MLRRLIALVIALSFGMYYAEALIADVHDGDASASEQAHYAGAVDQLHPASVNTAEGGGEDHGAAPVHSTHTCHAGHAHICIAPVGKPAYVGLILQIVAVQAGFISPMDLRLEPHLRPPIA